MSSRLDVHHTSDTPEAVDLLQVLLRIEAHLAAMRPGASSLVMQWLTVEQVAKELDLSRDTVERWVSSGRLPAAELTTSAGSGTRRRYRIRRDWLEDFLEASVRSHFAADRQRRRSRALRAKIDFIG